ncbi:MAG TPA: inositol monophosphatase family protein [Patescibacteria group bacterium]|nr:inositol monophosphatase family protein [Patescibacteria group bacterium]
MRKKIEVAREAILSAGSFLKESFGRELSGEVAEKDRNDFVTQADMVSERMITETLRLAFPGIGILAEEGTASANEEACWIIDPLDGTTNFIHGYPTIGVSIALMENGEVVMGLVYDPLREELFEATRGGGAFCNGRRIAVSGTEEIARSLLGTGFPFRVHRHLDSYLAVFKDLFLRCRGVRRAGAAVLDLGNVAAGRLDGFWELYLKPWDMAAGALLVREAGGTVTDFFGGGTFLESGNIVAATPAVHRAIVAAASTVFTPESIRDLSTNLRLPK